MPQPTSLRKADISSPFKQQPNTGDERRKRRDQRPIANHSARPPPPLRPAPCLDRIVCTISHER
jgi:hypothetical protein